MTACILERANLAAVLAAALVLESGASGRASGTRRSTASPLSPYPVFISDHGKDSTRSVDFCNFFAGQGLFYACPVICPICQPAGECYEARRAPRLLVFSTDPSYFRDAEVIPRRHPLVHMRFVAHCRVAGQRCNSCRGERKETQGRSRAQRVADYRTQSRRSYPPCAEPSRLRPASGRR